MAKNEKDKQKNTIHKKKIEYLRLSNTNPTLSNAPENCEIHFEMIVTFKIRPNISNIVHRIIKKKIIV